MINKTLHRSSNANPTKYQGEFSYHAAPCISFYFKSDYYYGKVVVCRFLMNLQHDFSNRIDILVKKMFGSSLPPICFVAGSYFAYNECSKTTRASSNTNFTAIKLHSENHNCYTKCAGVLPKALVDVTWFSCRLAVTRQVSQVEQELLTLPEHMNSPWYLVEFALLHLYSVLLIIA
jgi:hypothetical protein